jgi:hypothetical protein
MFSPAALGAQPSPSLLRDEKEQVTKMRRLRLIVAPLLASCAIGAVAVSATQAASVPYFSVGGARLLAGKTHNFDAKVYGEHSYTLTSNTGAAGITCSALGTEKAVLLGSGEGNPGKGSLVVVYSGCFVEGNGPRCELAQTERGPLTRILKTEPLTTEQVENVENSKGGKRLLEEFRPTTPSFGLMTLNFTGECTRYSTLVSGQVVGEVYNTELTRIELGQTPKEEHTAVIVFEPGRPKQVWLISGGSGKIQQIEQRAFAEEAVQSGFVLVLLADSKFAPEPNALWSPLP